MRVLVIDIGGSNVKFRISNCRTDYKFKSGKRLTPERMCSKVLEMLADSRFDVVSIGFPGPVLHGKPAGDAGNLGKGWVDFNYEKALGKRVKIINDAAMQALGSYTGGRMLFVGLGTGVGSALILDDVVVPLELGDLRYSRRKTVSEVLGKDGLKSSGTARWQEAVHAVLSQFAAAFRADYVVIGGGNAKRLKRLPRHARLGSNKLAFLGGTRLWGGGRVHAKSRKHTWILT
jgi:polyphosphate glucokinase